VAAHISDALVLRTYPLKEADLIVSFFTRDQGKLRGVAKRARRPKNSFGSGLERLSHVRMYYFQRENRELVNLDSCELIHSQFTLASDYTAGVALDFIAEVSEQLLPPAEPSERFFRLLLAVLEHLRATGPQGVWQGVSYYLLWAVRLSGILPPLSLEDESREIAEEILEKPIAQLTPRTWTRATAADLRRELVDAVEEHVERRLVTLRLLESAI
jgi:DNA repair protein RecO (recombination protein O)